jgi:catabolite regulation protein CreA
MEVDFNALRKKLIHDYNKLIESLNGAICTDIDMDRVVIPVQDISIILEKLRHDVITIGALNDPSIKNCSCVLTEDTEIKEFLPNV